MQLKTLDMGPPDPVFHLRAAFTRDPNYTIRSGRTSVAGMTECNTQAICQVITDLPDRS